MKNNLLLTTALVSVAFAFTANAWAETGDATHKVTTADETISENLDGLHAGDKTDAQGGAVYHTKGTLTVKDGVTFSGNSAQRTGGAISAYDKLVIGDNVTFKNNTSIMNETDPKFNDNNGKTKTEMGGAIYVEGTNYKGEGNILTIGKNATFSGNTAANGIVYLYNGVTATIGDNVSFVDNKMGVELSHATKSEENPISGTGVLTLAGKNDVTIGNNALFARNEATFGAAVSIDNNASTLTFGENTTFSGNKAKNNGGAISNGGKITFNGNALFENNSTTQKGGATQGSQQMGSRGGAIYNNGGTLEFGGTSTFRKNNSLDYGGAIFTEGKSTLTFKDNAIFDHNNADQFGGAIYSLAENGNITFEKDATFTDNSAQYGGAIFNAGKLEFDGNTVFSNNSANGKLNDIYNHTTGKITVKDGSSLTLDGGITGSGGTFTLEEGSILNVHSNTTIASKVTVEDKSEGTNINVKLRAGESGFSLKDIFGEEKYSDLEKHLKTENGLFRYTETEDGTYTSEEKSAGEVASGLGVKKVEADTLLGIMRTKSTNEKLNELQNTLADMAQDTNVNSEAVSRATDALGADGAPVVRTHATMLSNMIFDTADEALSNTLQNATVGQSSGDSVFEKAKIWVKGLFNYADKDDTSKAHGFDMDTYGAAMGVDKEVGNGKVGLGYAYSKSDIDGYTRNTDVKTHTAFVYGQYQPADWYVKGVAAYSWSDYKEKKSVLGENADSKYDVDTLALQGMFSYNFHVENDYDVTPEAGLRYLRASQDASTNALGVRVKARDIDVLTAVAGVKVAKNFALTDSLTIRPEVRAALTYDLDADNNDSIVTMGNTSYRVNGEKLERFGYELGAKLATDITSQWEVSAGYEGRFRDEYQDHSGILSAKYKF